LVTVSTVMADVAVDAELMALAPNAATRCAHRTTSPSGCSPKCCRAM